MKSNKPVAEYVRPMLAAMARSIDAALAKRAASSSSSWNGSPEGAVSPSGGNFRIGTQVAANGKSKAKPNTQTSSFFRDRDSYRKAG